MKKLGILLLLFFLLPPAASAQAEGRYKILQCAPGNKFFSGFSSGSNVGNYRNLEESRNLTGQNRLGNFFLEGGYRPRVWEDGDWSIKRIACSDRNSLGASRRESVVWIPRNGISDRERKERRYRISEGGDSLRQNIRFPAGASILSLDGEWAACRVQNPANRNALPQVWLQGDDLGNLGQYRPFRHADSNREKYLFPAQDNGNYFTTPTGCDGPPLWKDIRWGAIDPCASVEVGLPNRLYSPRYRACIRYYGGMAGVLAASVGTVPHRALARDWPAYVLRFGLFCRWDPEAPRIAEECYRRENFDGGSRYTNKLGQAAEGRNIRVWAEDTIAPRVLSASLVGGSGLSYSIPGLPSSLRTFSEEEEPSVSYSLADSGGGVRSILLSSSPGGATEKPRSIEKPLVSPPTTSFLSAGYTAAVAPGRWSPSEGIEYRYRWEFCAEKVGPCRTVGSPSPLLSVPASGVIGGYALPARGWLRAWVSAGNRWGWSEERSSSWIRYQPLSEGYASPETNSCRGSTSFWCPVSLEEIGPYFIGSPRDGQTITLAPGSRDDSIISVHRCRDREGEGCVRVAQNFAVNPQIRLGKEDIGKWLVVTTSPRSEFSANSRGNLYPGTLPAENLVLFGSGSGLPASEAGLSRNEGILPETTVSVSLCQPELLPVGDWVRREDVPGAPSQNAATRTNPCPSALQSSWEGEGFLREGLNRDILLQVRDFCTREYQENCYSNSARRNLGSAVLDTTAPSFADPRDLVSGEPDKVLDIGGREYWVEGGVRCKAPDGEGGWHRSDPECSIQSVDVFRGCWQPRAGQGFFPWGESGCQQSSAVTSGLQRVYWEGDTEPGRATSGQSEENRLWLQGERPSIRTWARDRVGNESDDVFYEDFVRIDRTRPESPRILQGPSLLEPEGWEKLPETDTLPEVYIPRPPDVIGQAGEEGDCELCWEVEGVEEGSGGSPEDFDYDRPGILQCQLIYGGTGRTPTSLPGADVLPAWAPLDGSVASFASDDNARLGDAAQGGRVVAEDMSCAREDGEVSPFRFDGRPDGHYLFRVRQKDRAGWTSTWSGRPLVRDTTPPEPVSIRLQEGDQGSPTRQWEFDWGWDLLQRGGEASSYCFVAEQQSSRIVRRSGWGCGWDGAEDGPDKSVRGLRTPMPFPGVEGEGRGTLAGLPDGAYFLGVWQRDRIGNSPDWRVECDQGCISFSKGSTGVGVVPEPSVSLEASLPTESVTSRRTEAELRVQSPNPLQLGQAFFPMDGWISHATPQELYSYCQPMDQNYSEYWPSNAAWQRSTPPVGDTVVGAVCPDEAYGDPDEEYGAGPRRTSVRYEGSLALGGGNPASPYAEGLFTLNIFWLRPTLQDEARPSSESAEVLP